MRSDQGPYLAVRQAFLSAANSAAGKIGGKSQNNAAHKDGVWYNAFCDNPNCVEKSEDGNGKLGKSKEGSYPSAHKYKDENRKTTNCGKGTRGLGYYRIRI